MIPTRYRLTFLLFIGTMLTFAGRVNMSMGIIAITEKRDNNSEKAYNWSHTTKKVVLSSFFVGYICTQIPAGYVCKKYGCKLPLFFAVLFGGIFNVILPFAAIIGDWHLVVVNRILQGAFQGFFFPSIHTFLSKWAPFKERTVIGIFIYSGVSIGSFIMSVCSGYIHTNLGWESIFFISGGLGIIWAVIWHIFGASSPSTHSRISLTEREMIEASLGVQNKSKENAAIPCKAILTSKPFISLTVSWCLYSWGFILLIVEIPLYFSGYFQIDIRRNGLLSGLPFLIMFITNFIFITIDYYVVHRYSLISVQVSRKMFNTFGVTGGVITFFTLSFLNEDQYTIAALVLSIGVGTISAVSVGSALNHIDLSPNNAGILVAITNLLATFVYIITPLFAAFIVHDTTSKSQWRLLFLITTVIGAFGGLIFLFFGSSKEQPWNNPEANEENSKTT